MKRWDFTQMQEIGQRLFAKFYKQKRLAHHNHDVHFLAREIDMWVPDGIQAMREELRNSHTRTTAIAPEYSYALVRTSETV